MFVVIVSLISFSFFYLDGSTRDLHVLTHPCPTRRASDLARAYPMIRRMLDSPLVVAVALVGGGIAILVSERLVREPRHADIDEFSAGLALRIGLVQLLSMVPGVSRSGATIMGALMMGVERKAATE